MQKYNLNYAIHSVLFNLHLAPGQDELWEQSNLVLRSHNQFKT